MNSSDAFFQTLETLSATPGKKDKQAVVAGFGAFEQRIAKLALDPTLNYYIAKLDTPTTIGAAEWEEAEFQLLADLASRTLTGNAALEQVGFSLRELSHESGQLLRRVILKDLRCGVGVTIVNAAFPGLIPDYPYMRCSLPKDSNFDKWDWSKGMISQLKANGMFARIDHDMGGNVMITSRQGNTFPAAAMADLVSDIRSTFHLGTQTHGELTVYIGGVMQTRATGNGILNRLQGEGELDEGVQIRFDAWDQIPLWAAAPKGKYTEPYKSRLGKLELQISSAPTRSIELIESRTVYSKAEAMDHYREVIAKGLEGTVVSGYDGIWKDGDSKDKVKFKLEVDVDLKIVGFRDGTDGKRTAATFGSVICQTADGLLEVAVSGFKRDMELYLHENRDSVLDKVMCVKANEVSKPSESNELHSLFHPRFVELRDDKYEADTLQQVIDQFEAATA
jgi:DNA ligase 1